MGTIQQVSRETGAHKGDRIVVIKEEESWELVGWWKAEKERISERSWWCTYSLPQIMMCEDGRVFGPKAQGPAS